MYRQEDSESRTLKGFIHAVGSDPFVVHMYMEKQIVALRDSIIHGSGLLYLQATGQDVKNVPKSEKKTISLCTSH